MPTCSATSRSIGGHGWAPAATEEGLAAAARLLRSYHDAVRDWQPAIEPVWFDGSVGTGGPGHLVCHGDFGPWNLVWDGTSPVGLLDFEYARPGDPLNDVAYACEYFAPSGTTPHAYGGCTIPSRQTAAEGS